MKKIIAMLLALVMVLSLAACTAKPAETEAPTTEAPVETTEAPVETTEAPVETTEAPIVEAAYEGLPGSGIPGNGAPQTEEDVAENFSFGVDLSYHNVEDMDYHNYVTNDDSGANYDLIDFETMKADGLDFVILRIGSQDASGRFYDPHFVTMYNMAREAGLDVGAYFYSYAMTYEEAAADAEFCINVMEENNMYFDYPIFIDIEEDAHYDLGAESSAAISNIAIGWAQTMKDAGYFPGIYSSFFIYDYMSANVKNSIDYWVAYISTAGAQEGVRSDYNPENTNISNEVSMWQHDWHGGDEYEGYGLDFLDLNVSYKDYPSLMAEYGYNNYPAAE